MEDKINRFGLCSNCQKSWDGGDVLEALSKLNCNYGKTEIELKQLAANYGWTEFNKVHFSNLISHEMQDGRNLLECPNMMCGHVFDRYTGEEFRSMYDARRNAPIIKEGEFPTKEIPLADPKIYKEHKLHATVENRLEIDRKIEEDLVKRNDLFLKSKDEEALF